MAWCLLMEFSRQSSAACTRSPEGIVDTDEVCRSRGRPRASIRLPVGRIDGSVFARICSLMSYCDLWLGEDGVPGEDAYSLNEGGEFRNFSSGLCAGSIRLRGSASGNLREAVTPSAPQTVHTHLIGDLVSRVDLPLTVSSLRPVPMP